MVGKLNVIQAKIKNTKPMTFNANPYRPREYEPSRRCLLPEMCARIRASRGIAYDRSIKVSYTPQKTRVLENLQKPSVAIEMTVLKPVSVPK